MKISILAATLLLGVSTSFAAPSNTSPSHPKRLYFARGAVNLAAVGHIQGAQHRFYVVKMGAGQKLEIKAEALSKNPDKALVPLIFVTPPQGKYDGDKTAIYQTKSSRAGDYKIEVGANLMASNSNRGDFLLRVRAQ
jgi:hypothetical protein